MFNSNEDHFGKEEVNEKKLEELIKRKRKNSLYDVFLNHNLNSNIPQRRKHLSS